MRTCLLADSGICFLERQLPPQKQVFPKLFEPLEREPEDSVRTWGQSHTRAKHLRFPYEHLKQRSPESLLQEQRQLLPKTPTPLLRAGIRRLNEGPCRFLVASPRMASVLFPYQVLNHLVGSNQSFAYGFQKLKTVVVVEVFGRGVKPGLFKG